MWPSGAQGHIKKTKSSIKPNRISTFATTPNNSSWAIIHILRPFQGQVYRLPVLNVTKRSPRSHQESWKLKKAKSHYITKVLRFIQMFTPDFVYKIGLKSWLLKWDRVIISFHALMDQILTWSVTVINMYLRRLTTGWKWHSKSVQVTDPDILKLRL